ncbi:MAG: hypothetical protein K2J46_07195, partial [Muribaculaceae bacterium]|nr:hypothetical protein [Muribaculaceae bacterium]
MCRTEGAMKLTGECINKLSEKLGVDVSTPAGATWLQLDIETATGERLGLNTVKRLVGVLSSDAKPRVSTIKIISDYLGCPDWRVFSRNCFSDSLRI